MTFRNTFKKNLLTIILMLATFFNPLGFSELFALVQSWTNSFLLTDVIFYCISICLFILYYFLSKKWGFNVLTK